ncbi:hypothetical protein HJC23_009099 [Cyclotella cryptica]|uniref:O-fucosyltransferase family protein n=1 Tax=Cyclotella cryptica TaxID=29204 RepID=A0ABD3QYM4_9STRA|eukprot:CCRYP_000721-RB/>CCRYP_000721-RB protein AED:0.09 eAED:0.09 QI:339/1/1/1/0.5/0.33/3/108/559
MADTKQFGAMIAYSRKQTIRAAVIFVLILAFIANITLPLRDADTNDDDDLVISNYMHQSDLPSPKAYTTLSSFLDFSWASWGKDTTQFETLLPPSEIDFTIEKRLTWDDPDKCDEIMMLMPYLKANNGQGSQLNSYLMSSVLATFLGKALVILEPPRSMNDYETGSQFGCPVDAFEDDSYSDVKEDFPDGILRLINHPKWLSRGCAVPTCGGTMGYNGWEEFRRQEHNYVRGQPHEFDCVEGGRNIKVTPLGGRDVRDFFMHTYRRQMLDRSTPEAKDHAYNWATRLGAKHRDATHFSNLVSEQEIWDYLTALINRSGLLRFQPWIARDVAEYIKSSNLPLDISYDAIHVRRGDKLISESKGEVNKYWASLGFRAASDHVNYVPFSHYIEQAWDGSDCPTKANGKKKRTRRPKRIVYIATDDPKTVRQEIQQYPHVRGGVTVLNECTKALFVFSPLSEEHSPSKSFHISPCRRKICGDDDCFKRYHRNIAAIADLMILTKSAKFVGEFNSNWGRLIRSFRTVLNENSDIFGNEKEDEPPVLVRDTVIAFGPNHPGPVGW